MSESNVIRFADVFLCPTPCKGEVVVEQRSLTRCEACGKEFDDIEITELLLSQGRFLMVKASDQTDAM